MSEWFNLVGESLRYGDEWNNNDQIEWVTASAIDSPQFKKPYAEQYFDPMGYALQKAAYQLAHIWDDLTKHPQFDADVAAKINEDHVRFFTLAIMGASHYFV
ncbi:hypothetical protein K1X76_02095 [bacterium]|nr:hypothetical protein [bacterium]